MSKHTFSPGDMVRVVSSSVHIGASPDKLLIGEICEIKFPYPNGKHIQVWQPDKEDWWLFRVRDLEPVTHEEKIQQSKTGHEQDNQWRLIETAPRDGTRIIVSSFDDEPEMVFWEKYEGWCHWYGSLGFIPTYWTPVPEKPKKGEV